MATTTPMLDDGPEWALGSSDELVVPAYDSRPTIEQRYEIQTTLSGLGLADEGGVPIGPHDRFVLLKLIGRGSMGSVYLADDTELDRKVAIKVVARRLERERLGLRLRREARTLAALDHENVVKVFDLNTDGNELFIAMEYVAGKNLRTWQKDRSLAELLEAYLQVGRGLAAAHAQGISHRDVKPDNAFVDDEGGQLRVRVGDFGLAGEQLDEPDERAKTQPIALDKDALTASRTLLGTIPYMAPEQLRREHADAHSDQHQFCVALWEAIAGKWPFGPEGRRTNVDTGVPPRPATMPRWIHRVLKRGLAYAPERRYPSMDALLAALERGRRREHAGIWIAAAGAIAALTGVVWLAQPDRCQDAGGRIDEIWSADVRAEVGGMFEDGTAESEGVSERLVGSLDRAVLGWKQATTAVCMDLATAPSRAALARREKCLEQWPRQLEQRIASLRLLDGPRIEKAFELVAPLEHVGDACMTPPVPLDASFSEFLVRVEATEMIDLDGALKLANEAVDLAQRGRRCPAADPRGPLRSSEHAEALFRLGHVLGERGAAKDAVRVLTEAHLDAVACDDQHRIAEIKIHLAKVLAADLGDAETARTALEEAELALWHVQEPEVSLRRYDGHMAASLVDAREQKYDAAKQSVERGRDALGEHVDPVLDAKLWINLGQVLQLQARHAEANSAYDAAVELLDDHPLARRYEPRIALNLGLIAKDAKEYEEMRRHFREAVGASDAFVVTSALTAWAQGEFLAENEPAAVEKAHELLELVGKHDEIPPFTLALAETTAGQVLVGHDDAKSIEVLGRVCPFWRELGDDEKVASCELSRAAALHAAGRDDEARSIVHDLKALRVSGSTLEAIEALARDLSLEPSPPPSP